MLQARLGESSVRVWLTAACLLHGLDEATCPEARWGFRLLIKISIQPHVVCAERQIAGHSGRAPSITLLYEAAGPRRAVGWHLKEEQTEMCLYKDWKAARVDRFVR